MNFKKKMLFAAGALALCCSSAAAADYMHIRTEAGWEVINLDKVERLDFKGGNVAVLDADNQTVASFKQKDLTLIYVDDSTVNNENASVEGVAADTAAFAFDALSKSVSVKADGSLEVYRTDGSLIVSIPEVKAGQSVDLSAVEPGIVIIKSGNNSIKALLR